MQQPVKLKHEEKSTRKSSKDCSGRQFIVHFDNLENISEDIGYFTETGLNNVTRCYKDMIRICIHKRQIGKQIVIFQTP